MDLLLVSAASLVKDSNAASMSWSKLRRCPTQVLAGGVAALTGSAPFSALASEAAAALACKISCACAFRKSMLLRQLVKLCLGCRTYMSLILG